MRLLVSAIALLIGASGIHLDAATVEVRVTSGDLITGEVVEETASTLELKRLVLIKHKPVETSITVNKSTITMRKEVPPLTEQYEARRSTAPSTLLGQCAMARWCLDRALTEQALVHTRQAEQLDRFSPIVNKLYTDLGYIKVDDAWVLESDHLASTGKVKLGDAVMTKEEAAAAKEQTAKAGANARLEQQIRDAEWVIKTGERKLEEATERRDNAKAELTKAEAEAKGAANRREQLQKRMEARSGRAQTNRSQQQDREDQASLQQATADASRASGAQKKWERDLESAEEALAKVKASIEKAKATLPELQKQLEAAGGKASGGGDGKPGTPAGGKPDDKPAEKAGDRPATDKPKSRFGGE